MVDELGACFLVASPTLTCPFFRRTVVLLVEHQSGGSLGFVVNKPAEVNLMEVLQQVGLRDESSLEDDTDDDVDDDDTKDHIEEEAENSEVEAPGVMLGGPVSPHTGWVVFTHPKGEEAPEGVVHVGDRIGVSANLEMLESIAKGDGPEQFLMTLGYASWGPGQLDDEIREGSWITVDLDSKLVFDTPIEERWRSAFERLGIDPARMTAVAVA